jgi:glycosyltransferase involved in cell wall biosynthesis
MQVLHRTLGVWRRKVDAFFTLTHFAREKFIDAGLPAERIHVKYNSVGEPHRLSRDGHGEYMAFVGRLSAEKGIATLLEAWNSDRSLPRLKIAGDGPLSSAVQAAAAADRRIEWLGRLQTAEVNGLIASARALVMPSVWYETFGRTIAEAFAAGTPVIASNLGAMAELVADGRTGRLFEPGNAAALAARARRVATAPPAEISAMRAAARREYLSRFTPEHNYARLLDIYEIARASADARRLQRECEAPAGPAGGTRRPAGQEPRPPAPTHDRTPETKPSTEAVSA